MIGFVERYGKWKKHDIKTGKMDVKWCIYFVLCLKIDIKGCVYGEIKVLWIDKWKKMVKIRHEGNPSYSDSIGWIRKGAFAAL